MGKTITLDAGHYGNYNRSPVNQAYYESHMNWDLHLLLKEELEKYGFVVVTTRPNMEKDLALVDRGRKAAGTDFFISIHSNACGTESVDHPIAYGYVDDKEMQIDDISRDLGGLLAEEVAKIMETVQPGRIATRKAASDRNKDGKLNDEYYGVLHGAKSVKVPGIILEHSFHTNLRATNWLMNKDNLKKLATAEAKILAEYFGMAEKAPAQTPQPVAAEQPAKEIYRVRKSWSDKASQIGAFANIENAKKACEKGYSVYNSRGIAVYTPTQEQADTAAGLPYEVRIDISNLRIRKGPGTNYKWTKYTGKGTFPIVEEKKGQGATKWGRLGNGDGWVSLDYTYRIP